MVFVRRQIPAAAIRTITAIVQGKARASQRLIREIAQAVFSGVAQTASLFEEEKEGEQAGPGGA